MDNGYAKNISWRDGFAQIRKLLENEGAEDFSPSNPELAEQDHVKEHITGKNYVQDQLLSSFENTHEKTEKKLFYLN
ncbi:hypothetical protein GMRT_21154 [Giardia muris]|uniref:Uncharacterized protein n=1 Tax=Giardia muris TaxID=5742 RepID=A0A4Z1T016_GIAMU|nr:hypothetical protein GMRT_21140 [Giardia muris]TNJ30325.1 hypothetical protein GMRT_21154 [Giardia muris]|eukprot:TNJ30316.1 hypothetical protein GMRT_21140 [Giardia muris]